MSVSKHPTVRLHHVGIAVDSVDGTSAALERILGLAFDAPLSVDAQKVKIAYSNGDGAALELVEATSDKSPLYPILDHPIRAFITKHGEESRVTHIGQQHLCLQHWPAPVPASTRPRASRHVAFGWQADRVCRC